MDPASYTFVSSLDILKIATSSVVDESTTLIHPTCSSRAYPHQTPHPLAIHNVLLLTQNRSPLDLLHPFPDLQKLIHARTDISRGKCRTGCEEVPAERGGKGTRVV